MKQHKPKGFLLDSRASNKDTPFSLWSKLKQRIVLRRLTRRVKNLRKTFDQYLATLEELQKVHSALSEDTPQGTYQKIDNLFSREGETAEDQGVSENEVTRLLRYGGISK